MNEFQPSMTEWFASVGDQKASDEFRQEDNKKSERLETLYQQIGLVYERPERLEASDLSNKTEKFQNILNERGDELCAIRLVPKIENLPKLRKRGLSIRECYETWFLTEDIEPDNYFADICPHTDTQQWSTIFVVDDNVVFGEIVQGLHNQLTQGDTIHVVYRFIYDFETFSWEKENEEAESVIKNMLSMVEVSDDAKQRQLADALDATFSHDHIEGYFEAVVWPDGSVRFIDYNRLLPKYISKPKGFESNTAAGLRGASAFGGVAKGKVRVVQDPETCETFEQGDILVAVNTDIRFVPFMKKASAVLTDHGGILSHAAIVARELQVPCIIGIQDATTTLNDGDVVTVDADAGVVQIES